MSLSKIVKVPKTGADWMGNPCTVCRRKGYLAGTRVRLVEDNTRYTPKNQFKVTHFDCIPEEVNRRVEALLEHRRTSGSFFG